ncbi:MAG: glycosyltransferase family 39 protein [Thermoguttaceae bacterium]
MADAGGDCTAPQSVYSRQFPAALLGLLALTALLRSVAICRPLLGAFATKNVVYAMIARNWAAGSGSLLCPTLDVLRGGQRAWHMVEFPVAAYLTGALWWLFGGSLDVWGRLLSVVFSIGSVGLMFLFVRRRHGHRAATAAAFMLAVAPVSIIYGQSFMLEASVVFFSLATFYALDRRLHGHHCAWLMVAAVCLAMLLLTKIYMLVLLLPLAAMWMRGPGNLPAGDGGENAGEGSGRPSLPLACIIAGLAIVPAGLWYGFAYWAASPESPFVARIFYSVRQSGTTHLPPHPLLLSPEFYRQLLDDMSGVVLTPVGLMVLLAGLLDRRWRQYVPWLLAMLALVLVLPRKFQEMNYYWLVVLPPFCIIAGLGWDLISRRMRPGRLATVVLVLATLVFSLRYAAGPAFITPAEDRAVVVAGRAVQELTAAGEPIVTMHGTTIDLLYYCNRPGWAVSPEEDLEKKLPGFLRHGAKYLVIVGSSPQLSGQPTVRGDGFRVYRLSTGNNRR